MSTVAAPFSPASPTAILLGEIVTWEITGIQATKDSVRQALTDAGLDPAICRDLNNRNAFIRGLRALTEQRIIRKIDEDGELMRFQFTTEARLPGRLDYLYEAVLTFSKASATIQCDDKPELVAVAAAELAKAIEHRRSNDITNMVQAIFSSHGDLFQIRNQGGAYFVPTEYASLVEKVESFVSKLGGNFRRFPIPAGYASGTKAVKESVAEALSNTLAEYSAAIAEFSLEETSARRLATMAQRVQQTRIKIEGYAFYLQDEATKLLEQADECKAELAAKVNRTTVPMPSADTASISVAELLGNTA